MFKKSIFAISSLIISSIAVAGTMGPVCTPGNVTVPCVTTQWDLGIQALYLQSIYTANRTYQSDTLGNYVAVENEWDWGYRLEGSYHFNTGNDINLNWTHFESDVEQDGLIRRAEAGLLAIPGNPFSITGSDHFDQVNLEVGQHVDISTATKLRFYGGAQYANIQLHRASNFNPAIVLGPTVSINVLHDTTDYKGLGVLAGIDYAYYLTSGLSITANAASSILYGTSHYKINQVASALHLDVSSTFGRKNAMVPSLEAKLGLNYAYGMPHGVINIQGGYQAFNYFNALQGQLITNPPTNPFTTITNSDYEAYGPYFGVNYTGMA